MMVSVPPSTHPFTQPVSVGISHIPDTLVGAVESCLFYLFVQPDLTRLLPAIDSAPGASWLRRAQGSSAHLLSMTVSMLVCHTEVCPEGDHGSF